MTIDELAALIADAKAKGLPGETEVQTFQWRADRQGVQWYEAKVRFQDIGGRKVLVIE